MVYIQERKLHRTPEKEELSDGLQRDALWEPMGYICFSRRTLGPGCIPRRRNSASKGKARAGVSRHRVTAVTGAREVAWGKEYKEDNKTRPNESARDWSFKCYF